MKIRVKKVPSINNHNKEEYCGERKREVKTFMRPFSLEKMQLFKRNLSTLRWEETDNLSDSSRFAEYDACHNHLKYKTRYYKIAIFHEMFHVASTVQTKKWIYSGFSQINKENGIAFGLGLTEGYVHILDMRYFKTKKKEKELASSAILVREIVGLLEIFVGKEYMENLFFHADLYSLILLLKTYMPEEKIEKFILLLDSMYIMVSSRKKRYIPLLMHSYSYCNRFLGECFLVLVTEKYYKKEITREQYLELLQSIFTILQRKMHIKNCSFLHSKVVGKREYKKKIHEVNNKILKKYA